MAGSDAIRKHAKQKRQRWADALLKPFVGLDAADFDSVGSFWRIRDFKADFVTFAELVETNTYELVGVEKEIFFLTLARDEPETLIGETSNCSFLHGNENNRLCNASRQETGVEARSLLLWIRAWFDRVKISWSRYLVKLAAVDHLRRCL